MISYHTTTTVSLSRHHLPLTPVIVFNNLKQISCFGPCCSSSQVVSPLAQTCCYHDTEPWEEAAAAAAAHPFIPIIWNGLTSPAKKLWARYCHLGDSDHSFVCSVLFCQMYKLESLLLPHQSAVSENWRLKFNDHFQILFCKNSSFIEFVSI